MRSSVSPSGGLQVRSPARSGASEGPNTRAPSGEAPRKPLSSAITSAWAGVSSTPACASATAGRVSSPQGSRPRRRCAYSRPAVTPGHGARPRTDEEDLLTGAEVDDVGLERCDGPARRGPPRARPRSSRSRAAGGARRRRRPGSRHRRAPSAPARRPRRRRLRRHRHRRPSRPRAAPRLRPPPWPDGLRRSHPARRPEGVLVAQEGRDVEVVVDLELPQRRAIARALGLDAPGAVLALEAGRDHGHPELIAERLVDGRAEDDVGLAGRGLADRPRPPR